MLNIYKSSLTGELQEVEDFEKGSWINLTNPTESEIQKVSSELGIDIDFIKAPLDDEESPRLEIENNQELIIVDMPMVDEDENSITYYTLPLGIIITERNIITTCLKSSYLIDQFIQHKVKSFFTFKKNRFLLQILFKIATRYLLYLKQIDKISDDIEYRLHKSTRNKELIQMLELQKSLVYFSTSLKSNDVVMQKILKMEAIKLYPEDQELLEDVIIENKQAIEMTTIYSNILSGTMDAFASIISNNQNIVMKFLTTITIVMAIPNIVSGFFGMNVEGIPLNGYPMAFATVIIITTTICGIVAAILAKKRMF
ncbi:Mg2+ transporter protein, CorA-like protein [Gottschalkia acidurici 9a]|uniref:Mg2+ transporter protein, CorA-like protein n=1 Tax=Gottschalkia acidurici (strain ATCC 7906 / DSM 604 / BCRC 14475 / CIP 104303 / KCTC 5404 / NCIMB 10678 / 9a) TaxID=1128398 RepID=K0AWV5_GOTA9|nr:magnesium transporter CorA family protein [Gottschalkia acidurici]AFS77220.1 Mg2+ transporter protein, CorA-like protein [Gottschalkia acidurici 9a]